MSRGNKRGPNEMGPMTGRGLGYCAGYDAPGFMAGAPPRGGAGYGRGYGFGRRGGMGFGPGFGFGRGRRFGYGGGYRYFPVSEFGVAPVYDPGDHPSDLAGELAALKAQLQILEERIGKPESKDEDQRGEATTKT